MIASRQPPQDRRAWIEYLVRRDISGPMLRGHRHGCTVGFVDDMGPGSLNVAELYVGGRDLLARLDEIEARVAQLEAGQPLGQHGDIRAAVSVLADRVGALERRG
jgi:hypothetical protein